MLFRSVVDFICGEGKYSVKGRGRELTTAVLSLFMNSAAGVIFTLPTVQAGLQLSPKSGIYNVLY